MLDQSMVQGFIFCIFSMSSEFSLDTNPSSKVISSFSSLTSFFNISIFSSMNLSTEIFRESTYLSKGKYIKLALDGQPESDFSYRLHTKNLEFIIIIQTI